MISLIHLNKPGEFTFIPFYRSLKFLIILLTLGILTACSDDEGLDTPEKPSVETERLESAQLIAEFSAQSLQSLVEFAGYGELKEQLEYSVEVYRVDYHTRYKGEDILASGLICLPVGITEAVALLSAQHGTEFEHEDAPSLYKNNFTGVELFSSLGYVTTIPDYIGYGASSEFLHPYYNFEHTSGAVIDMIFAAKELASDKGLILNDQLFLFGYSEGGYATLAAHKAIQEDPDLGLTVTASVAGAGGYNLTGIMDTIFSLDTYPRPDYLAFILHSYQVTLDWDRPLSYFFSEPYAQKIPGLFDGLHGAGEVAAELNTSLSTLFTPAFLKSLDEGGDKQLTGALEANSLDNWVPKAPIQLYHGDKDAFVPFSDSQHTYHAFREAGATQVELISLEGADHSTGFFPMIEGAVPFFQSF